MSKALLSIVAASAVCLFSLPNQADAGPYNWRPNYRTYNNWRPYRYSQPRTSYYYYSVPNYIQPQYYGPGFYSAPGAYYTPTYGIPHRSAYYYGPGFNYQYQYQYWY